jgi:hypothetical protein
MPRRSLVSTYEINVASIPQKDTTSSPPGYVESAFAASTRGNAVASATTSSQPQEETPELYKRRSAALSALSFSPLKQVGMTSFMMYMTGSNLHFFSILTVINGIYSPVTAILRSGNIFQRIEGSRVDVTGPRFVYCMVHLAGLMFALYRVQLMGLLPTNVSDWSGSIGNGGFGRGWTDVTGVRALV